MDEMAQGNRDAWSKTIERVTPAIVALRINYVRAFDGNATSSSVATGFVVDKEQGIILTNRHVISGGPIYAEAIFLNKEEVALTPIYRDPVHDFGFFKFDPNDVRFLDLAEVKLTPEKAKVGVEIRVIGNDSGEKLQILSGTIARLDREAPEYGSGYNDFNTFYYSAASSTSGGSSGSPVIDVHGDAIALNAAGSRISASSFYLPLDRVVRALKYIQKGRYQVPRGTIQTVFKYEAFDEARRLGLTTQDEEKYRVTFKEATGVMVVDQVVPGGPGHSAGLNPGDIVINVNGNLVNAFTSLEGIFDDKAVQLKKVLKKERRLSRAEGRSPKAIDSDVTEISVDVQRGEQRLTVKVEVQNLHDLVPDRFLEISGSTVHTLSYHLARRFNLPVSGVYQSSSGYMLSHGGMYKNSIIVSVGSTPTPDLDAFEKAMSSLADLTTTTIRYFSLHSPNVEQVARIIVDRRWFRMSMATREEKSGNWTFRDSPNPPPPAPLEPRSTTFPTLPGIPPTVVGSMVTVTFNMPYQVDAMHSLNFIGAGIILDEKKGLVLCDRNTVVSTLGDVVISVASAVQIPGTVVFLHPMHNYALVQYDPAHLGNTPVASVVCSDEQVRVGDECLFVGLTHSFEVSMQPCRVVNIERINIGNPIPPQFTAKNQDVVVLDRKISNCTGGVLLDSNMKVKAFFASFHVVHNGQNLEAFFAMKSRPIMDVVERMKNLPAGESCVIRSLGLDTNAMILGQIRTYMGLPDSWVERFETCKDNDGSRKLLAVAAVLAGTKTAELINTGDVLLAVDNEPIMTNDGLVRAVFDKDDVEVTVLRNGEVITLQTPTLKLDTLGTTRFVSFAGLLLQPTYLAVRFHGFVPESSVYISRWSYGSPAQMFGVNAKHWVLEVNDEPTPDLDAFIKVVSKFKDRQNVRLKTINFMKKTKVFTLRMDLRYWKTAEYVREGTQWVQKVV